MEDLLQIGAITRTHGVHGEVKVFPMTDNVKRFKSLKNAIVDMGKEKINIEVEGAKFFKQFVILKFKGIDSIDDVMPYCGKGIFVTRENAVKLAKDEYFIADLIDMRVIDENDLPLGVITDVLTTGANDVYVINMDDGRELLLPAIKECVLDVNMDEGIMKIHILAGLLD